MESLPAYQIGNEEGKQIAAAYTGYTGKACSVVVTELVQAIDANGYFAHTIDGNTRNIVLQLEAGSAIPHEGFLDDVAGGAVCGSYACEPHACGTHGKPK